MWFDKLVCAIHSTRDMVSLVLMLDEDSQNKMLQYVLKMEHDFEQSTGLRKHIPHTKLLEYSSIFLSMLLYTVISCYCRCYSIVVNKLWNEVGMDVPKSTRTR